MDLLANIRVLLVQMDAELNIFKARVETALLEVSKRAQAAGVELPKITDPAPPAQGPTQ